MPPLIKAVMLEAAKTRYRTFNFKLDSVVPSTVAGSPAGGMPSNLGYAAGSAAKKAVAVKPGGMTFAGAGSSSSSTSASSGGAPQQGTPMPFPPALVREASTDKRDVDHQKFVHDEISTFLDRIFDAIVRAHTEWKQQARLADVRIEAILAIGGRIDGPSLESWIKAYGPQTGYFNGATNATNAIAAGLAREFGEWQRHTSVPGLPWYPAFAAFPGPMTPPMPNVPTPLVALKSAYLLLPQNLQAAMQQRQSGGVTWPDKLYDAVAHGFLAGFAMWVPSQQVMMVMGKGPVPTFAPPYVPVGPVRGGDIISSPGHFAT